MLDPQRCYKPLDFGNGLVAGCINNRGRFTALNTYSSLYGYATLTGQQPFPEDKRFDPAWVRSYRAGLADSAAPSFGFTFKPGAETGQTGRCSLDTPALPRVQFEIEPGLEVDILTFAPYTGEQAASAAIQFCYITNRNFQTCELAYSWSGDVYLARAAYAQLTEGGPLPPPLAKYKSGQAATWVTIENTGLGLAVAVGVGAIGGENLAQQPGQYIPAQHWLVELANPGGPVRLNLAGQLRIEPGQQAGPVAIISFGSEQPAASAVAHSLAILPPVTLLNNTRRRWQGLDNAVKKALSAHQPAWLVRQALSYIMACCALPVSSRATCLLTDHQLLPLAWTRDTYYQVQALLALRRLTDDAELRQRIDSLTSGHLNWLFELAERPQGYWGRSYLANGQLKDPAFQLDQQCYPLLEVTDYISTTGDTTAIERYHDKIEAVLHELLKRRAGTAWLFPTSETPADDRVEMPYHLSSQIVLWRVLQRLAELVPLKNFPREKLLEMAGQVQQAIWSYMAVEHKGQRLFCYLTDLGGNFRLYHDANDWPTLLAPAWGFVAAGDPVWQATLDFAFSPENQGGYYPGKFGGSGSVHTPHPWPLGDIQELYLARLRQDEPRQAQLLQRLSEVACWDGHLTEAYDENTGQVASRHWFGWPGAMLAMTLLDN